MRNEIMNDMFHCHLSYLIRSAYLQKVFERTPIQPLLNLPIHPATDPISASTPPPLYRSLPFDSIFGTRTPPPQLTC